MKNMKNKINVTLAFVMLMITVSFAAVSTNVSAAGAPVKLMYAKTSVQSSGGVYPEFFVAGTTAGYIDIDNIAYAKSVEVLYSNNGAAWSSIKATYKAALAGNHEAWQFSIPNRNTGYRATLSTYFVIKYVVNGQTYYDNNNGQNYFASSGGYGSFAYIPMVSSNLFVDSFSVSEQTFSGSVVVKNISSSKIVKVRYTTDNWATSKEINASYYTLGDGYDIWSFTTYVAIGAKVKFSVSYTVNGQTYWDSNFGANYSN